MADARHDLPADAPALFEAALATLPPETAVIPSARGRHPALHPAALGLLLNADRPFRAAIRLASRTGSASLPNALARPWRSSALLGAARRDAHRALMPLALAATPIGLVGWTNTGAIPSSLRLRGRPGVRGTLGRDAAVAALRRLLAETPPAVLEIPPPLSRHARLCDADIFAPDGRVALAATGQRLFRAREPRLLALASDPGAEWSEMTGGWPRTGRGLSRSPWPPVRTPTSARSPTMPSSGCGQTRASVRSPASGSWGLWPPSAPSSPPRSPPQASPP